MNTSSKNTTLTVYISVVRNIANTIKNTTETQVRPILLGTKYISDNKEASESLKSLFYNFFIFAVVIPLCFSTEKK